MADLGIECIDVCKDIAAALSVPIVSPVLVGIFSLLRKLLEHAKVSLRRGTNGPIILLVQRSKDDNATLVKLCDSASILASKLNDGLVPDAAAASAIVFCEYGNLRQYVRL